LCLAHAVGEVPAEFVRAHWATITESPASTVGLVARSQHPFLPTGARKITPERAICARADLSEDPVQ
jgi:hypothetical protein